MQIRLQFEKTYLRVPETERMQSGPLPFVWSLELLHKKTTTFWHKIEKKNTAKIPKIPFKDSEKKMQNRLRKLMGILWLLHT